MNKEKRFINAIKKVSHNASTNEGPEHTIDYTKSYVYCLRDAAYELDSVEDVSLRDRLRSLIKQALEKRGLEFDVDLHWMGFYK